MAEKMSNRKTVSTIANFIGKHFIGKDTEIDAVCSVFYLNDGGLSFVSKKKCKIDQSKRALVIAPEGFEVIKNAKCAFIFSLNPRLDFIKIANEFFKKSETTKIAKTAIIGKNCLIGKNVSIGEYGVIKDNVSVGDGTTINNHVVIEENTKIGKNCYIKSGAIIGEDGFGFARDENNVPLRFPHIGTVKIGNNVEVGTKTIIAKGALGATIVEDGVKIDDQVFIAHNCVIGQNTLITACVEISGGVKIGKNCWLGPNSTIRDGLNIGDNVFLGIGCSISKDIESYTKFGTITNLGFKDIIKINKFLKE